MNGKLLEILVKEVHSLPNDWLGYRWECFPKSDPMRCLYVEIEGAVTPLKTRGPNKGQRNYERTDPTTVRTFAVTPEEYDRLASDWATRTNNCIECLGEGKVAVRISAKHGTTFAPCRKCKGTGTHDLPDTEGGAK